MSVERSSYGKSFWISMAVIFLTQAFLAVFMLLPLRAPRPGLFSRPLRMADEYVQSLLHTGTTSRSEGDGAARYPYHAALDLRARRRLHDAARVHGTPAAASLPPRNRRRLLGDLHGRHLFIPRAQHPRREKRERIRMDRRGLCPPSGHSFPSCGLVSPLRGYS